MMNMSWISVKELMPKPLADVLTCHNGKRVKMEYMNKDGTWLFSRAYGPVTHWMLMPEPPKADQDK